MNRSLLILILLAGILAAQKKPIVPDKILTVTSAPNATLLNINRLSAWYESNGIMENNPFTGNSGVTYPRSTSTAIYSAGLLWGGYVNDGAMPFNTPRVNGSSYNTGMTPGAIVGLKTGVTEDPANSDVRIFRIRRDYLSADLKQDAAEMNSIAVSSVDTSHTNALIAQYKKDWLEWPATKGAPFYDADNDRKYSPKFDAQQQPVLYPYADEPGIADADQVIWYVANDIRAGDSPWKSKPIGLEMQVTIWGYNYASNHGLGNTIFKRNRLIYKGTANTPDSAKMSEFYIGQWSDPDLGDAGDDFVGCDSVLGAGYVYNSITQDREYTKFSLSAPAVGYIQLQGPTVKGHSENYARYDFEWKQGLKNQPVTSFVPFSAGSGAQECDGAFDPNRNIIVYQNLRGLPSTLMNFPLDAEPFINPITNKPTKFLVNGDPVTNTGWIDGIAGEVICYVTKPGDRRMLLSSGPFEMKLGETQEVIYALVGAVGADRLSSITAMKFFMKQSKEFFNYLFPDNPNRVASGESVPKSFLLAQNYPNPFNPTTTISFSVVRSPLPAGEGKGVRVLLEIFDVLGRKIATLMNEQKSPGSYSVQWNAADQPSGVYYYKLTSDYEIQTRKMILMK